MNIQLLEKSFNYEESIRILVIEDLSTNWHDLMFLPRMRHIKFRYSENELVISLASAQFENIYTAWITDLSELINDKSEEEMVEIFNQSIKDLIGIGAREKLMPLNEAMGLFAELLHLDSMLVTMEQHKALMSWHKPAPANHDSDSDEASFEIKAIGRTGTSIKISGVDQLKSTDNKPLFIKVFRLDTVKDNQEDSLGSLYSEISTKLNSPNKNLFQQKCAESTFSPYLGPEYEPLKFKFNIIEETVYYVDQSDFPQIKRSELPTGVSKVKYSIDLSIIEPFKLQ